MGREARCIVRFGGQVSEGRVLLETAEVVFRSGGAGVSPGGEHFRLVIPFGEMTGVEAVDGRLEITTPAGTAVFDLGAAEAEKWAQRILHPPNLLDKLGVKPDARVAVVGVDDEGFRADLRARTDRISDAGPADVVVWGIEDVSELAGVGGMRQWIHPDGALWVVWRKGRRELTENHVRDAALAAGLVDVKVARFSDTHSALKLVVPKARRASP